MLATALALLTAPALADDIPPPADGWLIQGTAYTVLVEDLRGLYADVPPFGVAQTKMCNVRFVMQPGRLTQTSYGKCLGGLQESMDSFLTGMFFWPADGADPTQPNGAGLSVTLKHQTWGLIPRIDAEPGTPFVREIDGETVTFTRWIPAHARSGPPPEPSKKQARAIGDATCVLSADVAADGTASNLQVVDCPEAAQKSALKAAKEWRFEPEKLDERGVASSALLTFEFEKPE